MTPHPSPGLLRAVDEGVLPHEIAQEVRSHLEGCQICAQLRQDLLDPSLAEPSIGELRRLRKRTPARSVVWGIPARYVAAAAVVAALLMIGLFIPNWHLRRPMEIARQTTPAYRLRLEAAPLRLPLAMAVSVRGQRDPATEQYLKDLGAALEPYRAGRYAEAASQLTALSERHPRSVEPPFYLGVSRLLAGNAAAAIAPLQKARDIGGEALNDDILWYLAVARERTGSWEQAAPLLAVLCQGDGPYRRAACEGKASP